MLDAMTVLIGLPSAIASILVIRELLARKRG